ncbi:hypothetical protein JCM33374_g89 [Metschnikowia sp. JCM 33374]|nr:hypothetical protein JCM33374_g89 [Metschnikowia sp. JCM 33374]
MCGIHVVSMEHTPSSRTHDPIARIPRKQNSDIRYLSFNVNGSKTLFNYHPWNQLKGNFNAFLSALDGDIVSLQELKIQSDAVTQLGLTKDYRAFISVPKAKKGYSGVGLFVRIPTSKDSPQVHQALSVVKAEEGITGRLKDGLSGSRYCDVPETESIGGYLSPEAISRLGLSEQDVLLLDSEGRCSVVELANNTVVFSLYCPANSMGTPEGQKFRLNFLEMMFQRCANLRNLGKKVVVMGDINVSPDLIDSAETINELIKKKVVFNNLNEGGEAFEKRNIDACLAFHSSTPHRCILHTYTFPSLESAPKKATHFLFDTTRAFNKRKLALYTVWNTMTNARQSNFGSRIDLILTSSEDDLNHVTRADILPFLNGSDHCPIMTDICVTHQDISTYTSTKKLSFEAKTFYKLAKHRDISTMFSMAATKRRPESVTPDSEPQSASDSQASSKKIRPSSGQKPTYTGRKAPSSKSSQQPIQNFFFQVSPKKPSSQAGDTDEVNGVEEKKNIPKKSEPVDVISKYASLVYDSPPLCHHNEKCILKTSKTQSSKGKKFWCCGRISKGSTIELGEHRCNFFEWTKKPTDSSSSSEC